MMDVLAWLKRMNGQQDALSSSPIALPDLTSLKIGEDWWEPKAGQERAPTAREPGGPPANYDPTPVSGETWEKFLNHLHDREGYRNTVYRDSLGKLTVGVGHLVKPGENFQEGQKISDAQVRELLEGDAKKAYRAAIEQANELGINDSNFVVALGSVNYQLGTGWRSKFDDTWAEMKAGNYDQAIENINNSLWDRQTPTRTADFTAALRQVAAGEEEKIGREFARNAALEPEAEAAGDNAITGPRSGRPWQAPDPAKI